MNTVNPDLFEKIPFWLPRSQAAASWLFDLDAIDVHTCSIEALLAMALSAPSLQAALWLLHVYFTRLAAAEEFLRHFQKIDFDQEERPDSLLLDFIVGDAPGLADGEVINAIVTRQYQAAPAAAPGL